MRNLSDLMLFLLLAIVAAACQQSTVLGEDLIDEDNTQVQDIDTLKVLTSTLLLDSIYTTNASRLLAGGFDDPYLGQVNAQCFFNLDSVDVFSIDDDDNLIFDSLSMSLRYDYAYPNTDHLQNLAVFTLSEKLDDETYYFNNSTMYIQPTLTRSSWSTLLLLMLSLGLAMIFGCNTDDDEDDPLGDWEQIKSGFPGVARNASVSFTIDNITYVGLGFDGDGERLGDFWAYSPEKGYWDNLGRLNTDENARFPGSKRNSAVAFALNGKGYVGLGDDDHDYKADFYEFNPATRSWRKLKDFPGGARRGAVAFVIGDKAYVGTGYDDNYLVDFWSYDAKTDTWTPARDFGGSKREGATAIAFNGKAYVGFGSSNGITQKNLYVFDAQLDTWTEIESLGDDDQDDFEARSNASAFVIDQRIFFFGGSAGGYYQGDIWAYDPALDTWTEHTALSDDCGAARATAATFAYNGLGYVSTGNGGAGRFDDLWFFAPDKEQEDCD